MFGLSYHDVGNEVDQTEKFFSCRAVIAQLDLTGVNRLVSDYADNIEGLLDAYIQALFYQSSYIRINVLAFLPELLAELLYGEAQKGGGSSG